MAWKALLKTEWNESLLNSYWWLFIISNNLTFFCVLLPGVWPLRWGDGLSPRAGACVCVCVWERGRVFALFICTRTCFMVNKQPFFCQSLSAADQISGRNAETALWKMNLGRSANFSQFGPPSYIQIRFKMQDVYCLWQHLLPPENGPTTTQVFEINPTECSARPRVLLPVGVFSICS